MKVEILVQNAQTFMLKPGTIHIAEVGTAKRWIKNKWAKEVKKPKK